MKAGRQEKTGRRSGRVRGAGGRAPRQSLAEMQARLQACEQHYNDTMELAAIGIAHVDADGRVIHANRWLCQLLGYRREELLGMTVKQLSHPEDRDVTDGVKARLRAGQLDSFHREKRYLRKDGSVVWVRLSIAVARAPSGEPLHEIAVIEDISARKAAEHENERSLSLLRATLDATNDGILVVDLDGRIAAFNGRFLELWRIPAGAVKTGDDRATIAHVFAQLTDPEAFIAKLRELCDNPERDSFDTLGFKDGRVVERYSRPQRIGGKIAGRVFSFRDVTERHRAEQLLRLEHTVTGSLTQAESSLAALESVIRAICQAEDWECGRYFLMDEKDGALRMCASWCVAAPGPEHLIERSRTLSYAPGVGLVGEVWQSGQPLWLADISSDPRLAQRGLAQATGMHGAFMFPVTIEDKPAGVLAFNSREVRAPDERQLQAVRAIGAQIGQYLQRLQSEERLRASEERFRRLTELSSDWYWETDAGLNFTRIEGRKMAGAQAFIGRRIEQLGFAPEEGWEVFYAPWHARAPFRDQVLFREIGEAKHYFSVSGEPVLDRDGACIGYRGVTRNITDRKRAEEHIHYLATHDGLTGLPNRVMFGGLLDLAVGTAQRYQRQFAVLFIDLDRFKIINDSLGHEAGDKLLQEISARLTQALRSSDAVARLGGDEFVVLVQEVGDPGQVATVARKILSSVIQPVLIGGQECRVTASIGICMYPADAQDEQSLMKNADIAMYHAKEEGKNNYQFFGKGIKSQALEKMALETNLRRALELGELSLHYQAKVELAGGAITGVEALLRWNNAELGAVSPAQFIPIAEETGLIVPIGKWVLRTACRQNIAWQQAGLKPVCVAVNLSPRQFNDPNLLDDIAAVLGESGMAAELLELEITESMVMHDTNRTIELLAAIKALGVRLAIDDFGTGYSSLAQLKRFPIDTLKVDRSFIREIPSDAEDKAIAQAIIAMGKTLSLTVIAEGVETVEQQAFLRAHACDQMQGYYFSKPVSAEDFAELLRNHVPASANALLTA